MRAHDGVAIIQYDDTAVEVHYRGSLSRDGVVRHTVVYESRIGQRQVV